MNYIKALKIYNDKKGEKNEWCVYRKGTPEYLEVMKIMKDFKEKPIKDKAVNTISNAFKIKQAKQELEKLKLEKAKKGLEKSKLEKEKKEEININKDKKNELFSLINDKYNRINVVNIKKYIQDIRKKEEILKKNPRLKNIKQNISDIFNDIIIERKKMIENFEILNNYINEYIQIYKNKIDYVYLYLTNDFRKIIIDMYVKYKNNQRDIDYIYNDEFNSYILKIVDKQIKDGELTSNNSFYSTVQDYKKNNVLNPKLIDTVFFDIRYFIYDFIKQNIYNNIQDYYNNNKYLYADINFYQKFINRLNEKPLNITANDFIIKLKEEINYDLIINFKRDYKIEDENAKIERLKEERQKWLEKAKKKKEEKAEEMKKEIPEEDKKIIIKLLDDSKNIIDKTNNLIIKNDIVTKLNNNKNNNLYNKLYNIFMAFRYNKNEISKYSKNNISNYKKNIIKLKEILKNLNQYYNDFLIELEKKIEPKKEEAKKPEPKKEEAKKPEPKKEPKPEIIEIPEKTKKISSNDYIEIQDNLDKNIEKYLPIYLPLFNINDLLGLLKFSRNDIKRLNIFLTPETIANDLIYLSGIDQQYSYDKNMNEKVIYDILEPTAGIGNLISSLISYLPDVDNFKIDAVEPVNQLYNIGKARFNNFNNIKWFNEDFLKFKPNKKYDYIFMNPPFNIKVGNKQYLDIDFVNDAYKLLKDDGKLAAIISTSYLINKTPKYKKFKDFIDNYAIMTLELNEGFKEDRTISKEMQTNVKMMIIIIDKQEDIESIL